MKSLPRYSVENPILVNLLMWGIILGGTYCAFTMTRELFPESRPNKVMIMTPYPGASPSEIEKGISSKIEEQIKDVEGIETIDTSITEGMSLITASLFNEFKEVDRAVTDIKDAIDAIPRDDFPEEAEETVVTRMEPKIPVIMVSLAGDLSDHQLKAMGKQLRDDLLELLDIPNVELSGTRADEISVEVQPDMLLRYGLSFPQIAEAIRGGNMDLPGGQVKTSGANMAVRTLGEEDRAMAMEDLIVRADPNGEIVRLSDVATLVDGFADQDILSRIDGRPGITVTIYKASDQDAVDIAWKVKAFMAGKTHQEFPDGLGIGEYLSGENRILHEIYEDASADPYSAAGEFKVHMDLSRFITGRLDLLTRNGFWGLIFVFVSLLIFLNWRVAFWVMMGLLLAIMGTLIGMQLLGISLNLLTMFGLIVVLGMLVDDAIIVGEHIYTKVENREDPKLAAITGAEEVTSPVTCAIATTVVAFAPLLFIKGMMGDFMGVLPVIVVCALAVSLFEALTILPSHLAETFHNRSRRPVSATNGVKSPLRRISDRLRRWQLAFIENVLRARYAKLLKLAVSYRYATMGIALAALIGSLGLLVGGKVKTVFIQEIDAETLIAGLEMPVGSPISRTDEVTRMLEEAVNSIPEMEASSTLVGAKVDLHDGSAAMYTHNAQIIMELATVETRDRSSEEILNELRERTAHIAGVNSITFEAMQGGPGGAPIQIEITGDELDDLVAVSDAVKQRLSKFDGVYDIEDDFDSGQKELQVELLDSGRALGLTTESLAVQVRAAFYGIEARKVQRDREDVKIMVRYPPSYRTRISDLELMRVATGVGTFVPLGEVARVTEGVGYATIRRKDHQRCVTVRANVHEARANSGEVVESIAPDLDTLEKKYPGVRFDFGGQTEEFAKSFGSLKWDFPIALGLVFVILAGLFKSYIQPLIVMTAIPFGLIGAVIGHFVMGYPLTILSLIGLVALSGIVVNDSLILVDFINRQVAEGVKLQTAVVNAGMSRLRAIMLTSITTILGLAPLLAEQSLQAKVMIPMGISIAFGLAFATVLTLIVVPCLYVIAHDVHAAGQAVKRFCWPPLESEAVTE